MSLSGGNTFSPEKLKLLDFEIEDGVNEKFKEFKEQDFLVLETDKRKRYESSKILVNVHWGQLKLFLTEFYALNKIIKEDLGEIKHIVYPGAAPGYHIFPLAELFSDFTYHLYDLQEFDKRLSKMENVVIYKKYFDETDIEKWKNEEGVFFISDIRKLNYDPSVTGEEEKRINEKSVWEDMCLQWSWIKKINPLASLIKFRLPYAYSFVLEEGKTRKYLDGEVVKQPFSKPTSSENQTFCDRFIRKRMGFASI